MVESCRKTAKEKEILCRSDSEVTQPVGQIRKEIKWSCQPMQIWSSIIFSTNLSDFTGVTKNRKAAGSVYFSQGLATFPGTLHEPHHEPK